MKSVVYLCLGLCLVAGTARAETVVEGWHEADTPPEQALDAILKTADDDNNLADYVAATPFYKPGKEQIYAPMFTSDFLNRTAAEESDKVASDCDGHYLPDKVCGFDYNPVTCTEDHLPAYYYRTTHEEQGRETVLFAVTPHDPPYASYTMVDRDGVWRLDAVRCLALPTD